MTKIFATILATFCLVLFSATALAAPGNSGQCPGFNDPANTKIDTNDGSTVLAAGTVFCIHASNNNTGVLVADGETTLDEYIAENIVNNGGQIPGISNYVIYSAQPTATTPVATPTPTPTETGKPTPTPTSTSTPTPTPSITETPSTNPTPTPTDVVPPPDNSVTPPPTDTGTVVPSSGTDSMYLIIGAVILLASGIGLATKRR